LLESVKNYLLLIFFLKGDMIRIKQRYKLFFKVNILYDNIIHVICRRDYAYYIFIQITYNIFQDVNEWKISNSAIDTNIIHLYYLFFKFFKYCAEGRVIISTFRRRYFGKRITKSHDRNRILKYGAYFIADTDIKKETLQCPLVAMKYLPPWVQRVRPIKQNPIKCFVFVTLFSALRRPCPNWFAE